MTAATDPILVHVTPLTTLDALGLVACHRCEGQHDASGSRVGTVVSETERFSVLLCGSCAEDPMIRAWLWDLAPTSGDIARPVAS